jgi:hypothetical protein
MRPSACDTTDHAIAAAALVTTGQRRSTPCGSCSRVKATACPLPSSAPSIDPAATMTRNSGTGGRPKVAVSAPAMAATAKRLPRRPPSGPPSGGRKRLPPAAAFRPLRFLGGAFLPAARLCAASSHRLRIIRHQAAHDRLPAASVADSGRVQSIRSSPDKDAAHLGVSSEEGRDLGLWASFEQRPRVGRVPPDKPSVLSFAPVSTAAPAHSLYTSQTSAGYCVATQELRGIGEG